MYSPPSLPSQAHGAAEATVWKTIRGRVNSRQLDGPEWQTYAEIDCRWAANPGIQGASARM